MAFIPVKKPRTGQPQQPVGLDRGSSLNRGLKRLWTFSSGFRDAATNSMLTANGSVPPVLIQGGVAANLTASSNSLGAGTSGSAVSGDLTVLAAIVPQVLTRGDIVTRWQNGGLSGDQFNLLYGLTAGAPQFFIRTSGGSVLNSGASSFTMTVGKTHVVVGRHRGNVTSIYLDGKLGSSATTDTLNTSPSAEYKIGDNLDGDGNFNGYFFLGGVWDRALSDSEILSLSQNPWQVFRPLNRNIFIEVAAGGTTLELTVTSFGATPLNPQASLRGEISSKSFTLSPQAVNTLHSQSLTASSANVTTQSFNMQELARLNSVQVSFLARDIDYIIGSSDVELLTAVLNITPQALVAKLLSTLTTSVFDADVQSIRTALLNSLSSSAFNIDINSIDTPFVLTLDSGPINMMIFLKLGMLGFSGTINDRLKAFFENDGALGESLSDLEYDWLRRVKGTSPGALNDMWMRFTGGLGYTGSVNDRVKAYWFNL